MNILITGAGGFLGKSIISSKYVKNHNIFKISSSTKRNTTNSYGIRLTNPKADTVISNWLGGKKIDICLHLAGVTPFTKEKNPIDFRDDLKIAQNITSICNTLGVSKLLFTSGWVVYSNNCAVPISENCMLNPSTEYGKSKLSVENYLKSSLNKTVLINLRLASIYGPSQNSNGLIPNLISSALSSQSITINSVDTKRDYLYIDDFIQICFKLFLYPKSESVDLNVGSGFSHRVYEVAKIIQTIFKTMYDIDIQLTINRPVIESSPLDNQLDISKLHSILQNVETTTLQEGLKCYIQQICQKK